MPKWERLIYRRLHWKVLRALPCRLCCEVKIDYWHLRHQEGWGRLKRAPWKGSLLRKISRKYDMEKEK